MEKQKEEEKKETTFPEEFVNRGTFFHSPRPFSRAPAYV